METIDQHTLNGRPPAKIVNNENGGGGQQRGGRMGPGGPGGPPGGTRPDVGVYYYHLDHLGTPLKMTDSNKATVWSGDYYPFGERYRDTTSQKNLHRFPGQLEDEENDLYYNWHRYYDPKIGRYRQADPIGLAGGMNLYAYASTNPLSFIDPMGLRDFSREETEAVIIEAGRQNLWQAFWNHSARGRYDYKYHQNEDTFDVSGRQLRADEFGNYLAGYVGYTVGGSLGLGGVSLGGVFYDFTDSQIGRMNSSLRGLQNKNRFDFDEDSRKEIRLGAFRALLEELNSNNGDNKCLERE